MKHILIECAGILALCSIASYLYIRSFMKEWEKRFIEYMEDKCGRDEE